MKLEKIEIQGFKSFYDYQVMEFRPGVTGIVGPNGCGKSNISDAISWVLGTQSATQLRGKRMDDLIFNGSRTRKPLGLAQVKMRMKSDDGDIPGVDDGVIEIGRRLFRTGESDYLLNGKVCRLRDIQEVTMDTGLGTTAYTVIEQGKIDQILSSKSLDRRELLEEAAGITRFKAKRRQADLKLQATRHNLLRLHDVMREIDKQVRNLARQAGKARKYRRLREEMMDFRLLVYIENYFDIFSRQEEALRRISGMQDHEMKTAVTLSSKEAETEDYKIRMIDSEKILSSLKEILFGMEIKLNNLTRSREEHKRRIGESKILIGKNRNRTVDLKSKRDERIQSLADEESRCRKIREDVVLQEKELAEKDSGVSEVKNKHSDFEKKWEKINKEHLDLIGHLAQLQALIVKSESELEQENNKYRRNRAEFAELEGELSAVLNKHKDEGDSLKNLSNEIDTIKSDMAVKSGKVKAYREELREKTDEIQQIKENITRLKSEIETMKTMQWADPGKFSAGEYLYELEKKGYEGLDGYLLEKITVSEKYRVGIERYLEDTIKYFIAEDLTKALDISKMVKEEKHGRAAFYIRQLLENMPPHPTLDIDEKEGVVSSLHREVKGRGDFAYFITRLFPDAYIVENINITPSLLELLKEGDLVSLGGDLLFSKGVFISGGDDADGAKLLDLQAVVREKQKELELELERLASSESDDRKIKARLKEYAEELSELELRGIEAQRRHSVMDVKVRNLDEEKSRLRAKKEILTNETDQIDRDKNALEQNLSRLEEEKETLETKKSVVMSASDNLKSELEQMKAELDQKSQEYNNFQMVFNQSRNDLRNMESNLEYIRQNIKESDEQIAEKTGESEAAESLIEKLSSEVRTLEKEIGEQTEALNEKREEVKSGDVEFKNLQGRVIEGEQFVKTIRKQHQEELKSINSLEITLTELSISLTNMEDNCQRELGRKITEYTDLFSPQEIRDSIDDVKKRLGELELRLKSLGDVNLTAFEEYEKSKERLEFYRQQEKDLNESIESLEKAMDRLESESRKKFREAFDKINANFKEIYSTLFEGGKAELSLPEGEDILECPINISAQPPGKRLQSITLLSGGEKAMTSIALLFGIFRYKPSPFCLLDEVDATLDEVNTGRFIKMINEYSASTQFLLITHNKRSMEIAQALYGVTMEEPGVSKLVSVSFVNQADSLQAAR